MKLNPFTNALAASIYIVGVVYLIQSFQGFSDKKETIFIPMFMLSLFVLSAAVMGFLFLYKPLHLYLDNHKKEALTFFLKTVGVFACFVGFFLLALVYTMSK